MKTITTFAFTKGAVKFFGVFFTILISLFYQSARAQFTVVATGQATTTTSTNQITVSGILFGKGQSTGVDNIAIGNLAIAGATSTATFNLAFGNASLQLINSGNGNMVFGHNAMRGFGAGFSNVTRNCAFGSSALEFTLSNSAHNCAFGDQALKGPVAGSSGKFNVGVGSTAGFQLSGDSNTVLGYTSGFSISGNSNVAIGAGAATANLTSGSRNVVIGYGANIPTATASDQLSIQNVIYGTNMNTGAGGRIRIGSAPAVASAGTLPAGITAKLRINGTDAGATVNSIPSLQLDFVPTYTGSLPVSNPAGTGKYLFIDAAGVISQAALPTGTTGVTTGCTGALNIGVIPRSNDAAGNLTCSQITDNGTTVQIATGATGTVTWNGTSGGELSTGGVRTGSPYQNASGSYRLYVGGLVGATAFIAYSDKRLKKNIVHMESSLEKINKINGYKYEWTDDFKKRSNSSSNEKQAGFIAQEIKDILPEAVVENSDGFLGVNYNAVMPLLAEGIKEQQKTINELKLEVAELKSKLNTSNNFSQPKITKEYFQIIPNPIEQQSKIVYKLDDANAKAMFIVYDLQGKMLKQINVQSGVKEGQLALNKSDLGKGMYILSLIINSDEMQSKRFLVL